MTAHPIIAVTKDYDAEAILSLLQTCFAYMEDRVDPPSSLHRLTITDIETIAQRDTILAIEDGTTPIACAFVSAKDPVTYVGKLAVSETHRGQGLARTLLRRAEALAAENAHRAVQLETRVELTENQAFFERCGFVEVARTAHKGFTQPTSITYEKRLNTAGQP